MALKAAQRKRHLAKRPAPTEAEAVKLEAAKDRVTEARKEARRFPKTDVRFNGPNSIIAHSPHTDDEGWAAQQADALGTSDGRVVEFLHSTAALGVTGSVENQDDADRYASDLEQVFAFAAENNPANPVETALLVQMAACHRASLMVSGQAARATNRQVQGDNLRLMNQTMRTFAAQADALHRLRTGGKQQVEVRYVYVDARTQTVVTGGSGEGDGLAISQQPHAPRGLLGGAPPPGFPMRGADPSRDALPVASDQGPEAMQDARGQEPGSAEG